MIVDQLITLPGHTARIKREGSWQPSPDEGWHVAFSEAFVCPQCLKVWATAKLESDAGHGTGFRFQRVPCEGCPSDSDAVPGSIVPDVGAPGWGYLDEPLLEALPDGLLEREFNLHLVWANRPTIGDPHETSSNPA